MSAAIVTGATSGIGKAIAMMLAKEGYTVYALGRNSDKIKDDEELDNIIFYFTDISDTGSLVEIVNDIRETDQVSILVNSAGVAYFSLHEEISPQKIHEMIAVNMEAPIILSRLLMRDLKKNKGIIINISSVTAKKINTHGCCYGATKAGLSSFSASLFEENRKYGIKVVTIHPDMTKTSLYRNADIDVGECPDMYILPEEIADAVKWVLERRDGISVTDITITPQRHGISKKRHI